MTVKEIRNKFKESIKFSQCIGPELTDYLKSVQRTFEDLWKNGYTTNFDKEFLKIANGYQINTGDYEDIHICQTFDLWSITANHKALKNMMAMFFEI